jgi:hydroxymethylbilane synthase
VKLRLATRPRPAARARGRLIAEQIRDLDPGLELELVDFPADPDGAFQRLSEHDPAPTTEMRAALLRGEVDLLVHAARDLPQAAPEGVRLAAVPQREDPRECLVSGGRLAMCELPPGARVASDGAVRDWSLRAVRPDLAPVRVAGPLLDRLAMVERGDLDGVIVALAPMRRMGLRSKVSELLRLEQALPAAGQGAAAVEIHAGERDLGMLLNRLDHLASRWCFTAEREFEFAVLAAGGGPCAAHAVVREMEVQLHGRLEVAGRVVEGREARPVQELAGMGAALAARLLAP